MVMQYVNVSEIKKSNGVDGVVLDVRTPLEYSEVSVPGSRLMPLDGIDSEDVKRIAGEGEVYVLCRSGRRAKEACELLAGKGVNNLHVVEGGIIEWERAGLPVRKGKKVVSLERQVRIAAGLLVVAGVLMGGLVHPAFVVLSGFVGAGLVFAGVTDTCGMGMLLARMPWNRKKSPDGACSV